MALIFVGGVNGVGKTSISGILSKKALVKTVHGTSELMKRLGVPIGDYAQFRMFPEEMKERAFEETLRSLALRYTEDTLLVTGHYVKILEGKVTRSIGHWYKSCSALLSLTADPESIFRRVFSDEKNGRRSERKLFGQGMSSAEKVSLIERAQEESIGVMKLASRQFRVPCFCIENQDDRQNQAVADIVKILRGGK